jgi:hypothetical protein
MNAPLEKIHRIAPTGAPNTSDQPEKKRVARDISYFNVKIISFRLSTGGKSSQGADVGTTRR